MVQRVATVAFEGIEVRPVDVQVQVAPGMPAFAIVGLPDKAVWRSRASATRSATSRLPSAGGGRMRSAAVTAGTSMCRSMRSSSGPDKRVWYWAVQRVLGPR